MKIKVRQIPARGLGIDGTIDPATLTLADDFTKFCGPVEVRGTAQLKGDFVLVGTTVRFKTKSLCARCLSAIEREHREKFDLTFEIDKTTEYIDLTDDIRQELLLGLPSKELCREDCKGICVDCGVDLNNETCSCKKTVEVK